MRRLKKSWPLAGIVVLAVLTLAVVGFSLFQTPEPPAVSGKVASFTPAPSPSPSFIPKAAFLGDSYTTGDGVSGREKRWTTLLSAKRGWVEANGGYSGTGYATDGRVKGGQSYIDRLPAFIPTISTAARPVVIVSGGRNDVSEGTRPDQVAASVTKTFTDLRAAMPKARIIALNPLWDSTEPPAELAGLGEEVKAAVTKVGGQYVDLGQPLAGRRDLIGNDGIHPNNAGHAFLADKINAALPKTLP